MIHSFAVVLGAILILLTLPGTIELTLLTFAGVLRSRDHISVETKTAFRKLAIVIPAHDEAASIVRCVRSIAACTPPEGVETQIVVVADNCTDATADLARGAGARVLERIDLSNRGKGFALKFAFRTLLEEGADGVFVVDADTIVDSNLLVEAARLFRAGVDGMQVRYIVLNPEASMRARLMSVAFMAFNVLRAKGRDRIGASAGIFGNGFGLSRATLMAVPYEAYSLVEDLEYHLQLIEAGRKIVFVDRTRVRAEMPAGGRGASTQRARWEGGRLRIAIQFLAQLLEGAFAGRTQLLEPAFDLMLLPLAFHVTLLVLTLLMPFTAAHLYALFALMIVAIHVSAGILVGGGDWRDFATLAWAPFYVAWKIATLPRTFQSARQTATWIRTDR